MSKPQLPAVPESILEKVYKPSGKCTLGSLVLMMGIGLPAAIAIGAAGHYIGLLFPLLVGLLVGLLATVARWIRQGCAGLIVIILSVLFGGLLYPAAIGVAIGYVTWLLARRGKCRSLGWAAGLGFLNGAVGYSVLSLITFQKFGMMRLSSQMISTYLELTSTPWWLYVLISLDALILVGSATMIPYIQVADVPFCEGCEEWYGDWQQENFSVEVAELLLQALKTDSVHTLEDISSTTQHPFLEVKLRNCSSCHISDFQVSAAVIWKETTMDKGEQEKTEIKSEAWFTSMVPAKLGAQLDEILFTQRKPQTKSTTATSMT